MCSLPDCSLILLWMFTVSMSWSKCPWLCPIDQELPLLHYLWLWKHKTFGGFWRKQMHCHQTIRFIGCTCMITWWALHWSDLWFLMAGENIQVCEMHQDSGGPRSVFTFYCLWIVPSIAFGLSHWGIHFENMAVASVLANVVLKYTFKLLQCKHLSMRWQIHLRPTLQDKLLVGFDWCVNLSGISSIALLRTWEPAIFFQLLAAWTHLKPAVYLQ